MYIKEIEYQDGNIYPAVAQVEKTLLHLLEYCITLDFVGAAYDD